MEKPSEIKGEYIRRNVFKQCDKLSQLTKPGILMIQIVQSSPSEIIRTLFRIRILLLMALLLVVGIVLAQQILALPLQSISIVLLLLLAWSASTWWRLKQPWVATNIEVFLNLVIDATLFAALLYWTGGATNPFVSLYLIPIAVAAASLPAIFMWATVAVCVAFYSGLMLYFIPLAPTTHLGGDFNLHVFGMWLNFILSAVLCGVFVAGIAAMVRRRDDALAEAREDALIHEQIVALGTMAAGVAHEINTPLATMSLVTDELGEQEIGDPDFARNITVLKRQIETCRTRLKTMVDSATDNALSGKPPILLSRFLEKTFTAWQIVRPEIDMQPILEKPFHDPEILDEQIIAQSIANMLNNAADASLDNGKLGIRVHVNSSPENIEITIDDDGTGVTADQLKLAGRAIYSTKTDGLGVGVLLSNASIGRFSGKVILKQRENGGTRTEIHLPHSTLTQNL